MAKKIENTLVSATGRPATCFQVADSALKRLHRASLRGRGMRLRAVEARALSFCNINISDAYGAEDVWLEKSGSEVESA